MRVKDILPEDFINYKLPSMFISTCFCDWKCCMEAGVEIETCQNEPLSQAPSIEIDDEIIYRKFISNPITKAVVIGGLEPMIQINEVLELINIFRLHGENCPFVIYTGYYPEEIPKPLDELKHYQNIIVKFGRYIPNRPKRHDNILGVDLISDNQYAEVIS